jgi:nicotinamidase-related amidase
MRTLLLVLLTTSFACADDTFTLTTRKRVETAPGSGRHHTLTTPATWNAKQTAIVVCDMWDKHWCPGATARVGEMVGRMNELLIAARKKGALIIHCPSDTMEFYNDTPQRKLARNAPKSEPKVPLERWCKLDAGKEGALPIDDSDGGCEELAKNYRAWKQQHPTLTIEAGDAITDSDEAYHLMRHRGITNVVVLGVHTNMCVLGRPFAIRQLTKQGLNVVLVRDLTDTMYNPAKKPFVSHFTGTDLVVEHIENHWCPTVTSVDFLGGTEFRFQDDKRPHLVVIAAEDEYKTEETLPAFALANLGKTYRVSFVFADAKDKHRLPGLDVLSSADAVLLSVRRRPLVTADLDRVRKFVTSGKPLIAIRTSSHAFAPKKGEKLPMGVGSWDTFDRDILGCEYTGHYSNKLKTTVDAPTTMTHAVIADWPKNELTFTSWLYKSKLVANDAVPVLMGRVEGNVEPVAWVRERSADRGRVFYTCLGHVDDFRDVHFAKLLRNGIAWTVAK